MATSLPCEIVAAGNDAPRAPYLCALRHVESTVAGTSIVLTAAIFGAVTLRGLLGSRRLLRQSAVIWDWSPSVRPAFSSVGKTNARSRWLRALVSTQGQNASDVGHRANRDK